MKSRTLPDKHAKRIFEGFYATDISIRTWYRIKRLMKINNLTLTRENLGTVAKLKQSATLRTPLKDILTLYLKSIQKISINGTVSGISLYLDLQRITGYQAHRTTITRWFDLLPQGFNREQQYKASELTLIYIAAFLYQQRNRRKNATN